MSCYNPNPNCTCRHCDPSKEIKKSSKREDLTGQKFNRLLIVGLSHIKNKVSYWKCLCDCGKIHIAKGSHIKEGRTKSCGCYGNEQMRKVLNKEPGHASWHLQFVQYKRHAKERDLEFDISFDFFKKICSMKCTYCGSDPRPYNLYYKRDGTKRIKKGRFTTEEARIRAWININGIDRVDSDIGYEESNCVPCCSICNTMKMDHSQEKFLDHIKKILEYQNREVKC